LYANDRFSAIWYRKIDLPNGAFVYWENQPATTSTVTLLDDANTSIEGLGARGVDTNGDGAFNALAVEVQMRGGAGEYTILGALRQGDRTIATGSSQWDQDFVSTDVTMMHDGVAIAKLLFSGEQIFESGLDGAYTVDIDLVSADGLLATEEFVTPEMNHSAFGEVPGRLIGVADQGIDDDGDGLFDRLSVQIDLDAAGDQEFTVEAAIFDSPGHVVSAGATSVPGDAVGPITIDFDGRSLATAADGPYYVWVDVYDQSGALVGAEGYATAAYTSDQFEAPPVRIAGPFAEVAEDTNGNQAIDVLTITARATIQEAGEYELHALLCDPEGQPVDSIVNTVALVAGTQDLPLGFDGPTIGANGLDGPYLLKYVSLERRSGDPEEILWSAEDVYTTVDYGAEQFDGAPAVAAFWVAEDLDPSGQAVWLSGRTVRQGQLTLIAATADGPASVQLALYDSASNRLAESAPVDGNQRIDFEVDAGQIYYVEVSGTTSEVDLTWANLVHTSADGTEMSVYGTENEDSLAFVPQAVGGQHRVTINGVEYLTDAQSIVADGDAGFNDEAHFRGTAERDEFVAHPGYAGLHGNGFDLKAVNFEAVEVDSSTPDDGDTARLFDSFDDDTLTIADGLASMLGGGTLSPRFDWKLTGFEVVLAYGELGGNNVAHLNGSADDDALFADETECRLAHGRPGEPGFRYHRAKLFNVVTVDAGTGGNNTAQMLGSRGADHFEGSPTSAKLTYDSSAAGEPASLEHSRQVDGFDSVRVWDPAGTDDVLLHDSAGSDALILHPGYVGFNGDGFHHELYHFDKVRAISEYGGDDDTARLFDSRDADTFTAELESAAFIGGGVEDPAFEWELSLYEVVLAYAEQGGSDVAHLRQSATDQVFIQETDHDALILHDGFPGDSDYGYARAKSFRERNALFLENGVATAKDAALVELAESNENSFLDSPSPNDVAAVTLLNVRRGSSATPTERGTKLKAVDYLLTNDSHAARQ
jgi:hypothetical protein